MRCIFVAGYGFAFADILRAKGPRQTRKFILRSVYSFAYANKVVPMFFANIFNLRPRLRPVKPKRVRNYRADEKLQQLWLKLSAEYFPQYQHLSLYLVRWSSRRQKRVLGSCHIKRRHVVMAKELDRPELWQWVEAVLYHEMCHAVLEDSVQKSSGKRQWHGEDFKLLEARHPLSSPLKAWIKSGGWHTAVRSDRSRRAAAARSPG